MKLIEYPSVGIETINFVSNQNPHIEIVIGTEITETSGLNVSRRTFYCVCVTNRHLLRK